MHQQLANYDPYTIQQVQFFIQKKTKYTALKSILVSVAILTLTIVLNLGLVEQLWIGRSQLDVTSTERKMSQQQFTQAFLCVVAKNTSTTLPNSTLYTFSQSLNRTTRIIPTTQMFAQNSYLLNITQQRHFQCYNLQGVIINDDIYMQLNVYDWADNFDFLFRVFNADQITGKTIGENSVYFQTIPIGGRYMDYIYKIKKIHGLIYDSLLIDYDPQVIYGFTPIYTLIDGVSAEVYSSVKFLTQIAKPYDTTVSYTLTRANIGQILGKLLSWFSIFVLLAAIVIKPILQYNYRVQLCKKLYDNQKLTRINISILSYIKYIISSIKRDIFDQSILYLAFEQLEIDLDLLNLIKKQQMMKKLIKQNEYVSKQIDELNGTSMGLSLVENNQDDQKQTQDLFIGKFLNNQLLSQHNSKNSDNKNNNNSNENHHKHLLAQHNSNNIPLITCPDPQTQESFITKIFKSLDCSETSISLISNKGQGYKTSWNTILTVICLTGVLWFIIFAGVFKMQPNYKISSIAVDYDESVIANVTINPEDILFRANVTDPTDGFYPYAVMLDQDDNVIENVTLLTGSDCDSYKQNLNQSSIDWYCLSSPIHLSDNGKGNKTKLGLKVIFTDFGFTVPQVEILLWQYNIVNNQLVKTKIYTSYQYSSSQLYKHDGQAVIYIDENQQQSIPENVITTSQLNPNKEFWTCNKPTLTTQAIFKGITYQLQPQMIKITKQLPTIWNVIDTAWGIVVLAFSVFLSRITRYLNIKERQKIIKGQQNQTRNDIISIVSTQYKLIYRVFGKQLEQVKYFYKTNLDHFGTSKGR